MIWIIQEKPKVEYGDWRDDIRWKIPAYSDEDLLVWSEDHEMMEWCEAHKTMIVWADAYPDHDVAEGWYWQEKYGAVGQQSYGPFKFKRDAIRSAMARCE